MRGDEDDLWAPTWVGGHSRPSLSSAKGARPPPVLEFSLSTSSYYLTILGRADLEQRGDRAGLELRPTPNTAPPSQSSVRKKTF